MNAKVGQAGTLESNDIMITVSEAPVGTGIAIRLTSSVLPQYGPMIHATLETVCKNLGVNDAEIVAVDKGALEYTIEARLSTALLRAGIVTEEVMLS